jgi:hypothetical protein
LTKLKTEKKDYYGLDQMCDLAVLFYKAGHSESKEVLYARFDKNSSKGYELCGQDQIIELDGLSGLLKVAEVVGKSLYNNKDDWEDSWRVDEFQKKNKKISIYKELEKAGKKNKYIKTYLKSINENKRRPSGRRKLTKFSYELVKQKIAENKFRSITVDRANDLSESEVKKLADELLAERDDQKKESYLRFFSKRKFPYDFRPILDIATGKSAKNTRLVEFALEALKYFNDKRIRQLAISKFRTEKNPCDYLCLLVSNYNKGDYKILVDIVNRSTSDEFIHSIVFGLIDIYEANQTTECKLPLETVYSKMNCGLHRADILGILKHNEVLSNTILSELKFDSYDEVRKLYRLWTKNGR